MQIKASFMVLKIRLFGFKKDGKVLEIFLKEFL